MIACTRYVKYSRSYFERSTAVTYVQLGFAIRSDGSNYDQ